MRKLIGQQWVNVDNIDAEEDGGLSFVSGEPFSEKTNPAFKASVMGFIASRVAGGGVARGGSAPVWGR